MPPSRARRLKKVLIKLQEKAPEVEACVVASAVGKILADTLPANVNPEHAGPLAATLVELSQRSSGVYKRGVCEHVLIKGGKGFVVLVGAGEDAVLATLCRREARLGKICLDMHYAAREVEKIVRGPYAVECV